MTLNRHDATRCADGLPDGAVWQTALILPFQDETARTSELQLVSADYACHKSNTTACGSALAARPQMLRRATSPPGVRPAFSQDGDQ